MKKEKRIKKQNQKIKLTRKEKQVLLNLEFELKVRKASLIELIRKEEYKGLLKKLLLLV